MMSVALSEAGTRQKPASASPEVQKTCDSLSEHAANAPLPPAPAALADGKETSKMSVSLTESAAKHVQKALSKRGKGKGLRLGVRTSGCSGLAYRIEYADEIQSTDSCFESFGVTVIVDAKSLPYLQGTQLDFVKEGLNEGFKFNNPNVQDECGCGESFTV